MRDESIQWTRSFPDLFENLTRDSFIDKVQSARKFDLRIDLVERAASLTEEVVPLSCGQSPLAFRDVAWNGQSRFAQLRAQDVDFAWGKVVRRSVNTLSKIHCSLPRSEISDTFHRHTCDEEKRRVGNEF
jgi:hypothetical protein